MAYNNDDGMPVWEFQLDAGIAPSPVVFEHEGQQKILVFAAGSVYANGPRGDSLWLLSLDGTMGPTTPNDTVSLAPSIEDVVNEDAALALPDSTPDMARGEQIYISVCNTCHGEDGQGGHAEGGEIAVYATLKNIFATPTRGG
jgi:mono/diheme cytochrome c family protein